MANHKSRSIAFEEQEKEVNHKLRSMLQSTIRVLPYVQIASLIIYKTATIILENMGNDNHVDPDERYYQ